MLPSAFHEYEPLASKQARGALFIPIHGFVGVTALTLAAAAAAQRFGATFSTDIGAVRIFAMPNGRVGVQALECRCGTPIASSLPPAAGRR